MASHLEGLREAYDVCKNACVADWSGAPASTAIKKLVLLSIHFLKRQCAPVELVSRVPGKRYLAFRRRRVEEGISRPANSELFVCNEREIGANWEGWIAGTLPQERLARISYTACLAPCLALELFDRQNKKGPATFFECVIGHVFARALRCNPTKGVSLQVEGATARLTMDFLFNTPADRKFHLAVKLSTRERVVQAWAHQRILDSAYGTGTYSGIMLLFGETKLDSRSHEVVEICVPEQWLVYQSLLSRMQRIYYFDPPQRYLDLTAAHPNLIQIRPFARLFSETTQVLGR